MEDVRKPFKEMISRLFTQPRAQITKSTKLNQAP